MTSNRRSFFSHAAGAASAIGTGSILARTLTAGQQVIVKPPNPPGITPPIIAHPIRSWCRTHTISPDQIQRYALPLAAAYKDRLSNVADVQSAAMAMTGWASFADGVELNAAIDARLKMISGGEFAPTIEKAEKLASLLNAVPYSLGVDPEILAQQSMGVPPAKALSSLRSTGIYSALTSAALVMVSSAAPTGPFSLAVIHAPTPDTCFEINTLNTELGLVSLFLGFMPVADFLSIPVGIASALIGLYTWVEC
jgi:hypothetical protein